MALNLLTNLFPPSCNLKEFCTKEHVYTLPQQNGIVEYKHRHLLEVARALQLQSHLPKDFWSECKLTTTYLINRMPISILKWETPYFRLFHKEPNYGFLKTFGCLCYATNTFPHKDKFSPIAIKLVFIGYSYCQKGYKLFDLST